MNLWEENNYSESVTPGLFDHYRFKKWFKKGIITEKSKWKKYAMRKIENELSKVHRDVA